MWEQPVQAHVLLLHVNQHATILIHITAPVTQALAGKYIKVNSILMPFGAFLDIVYRR